MPGTGGTPISLFYSTTGSTYPSAGQLVNGELFINITDGVMKYKDAGGNVQTIATKDAASGVFANPSFTGTIYARLGAISEWVDPLNSNYYTVQNDGTGFIFTYNGTEYMRVDHLGNLLVGTTGSSAAKVVGYGTNRNGVYGEVNSGTVNSLYGVVGQSNVNSAYSSGGVVGTSINNNTYGVLGFWSGSAYWSLYGNGNTYVSGTYQGSDERLKENVITLSGSLSKITALRPVEFDWKENTDQAKNGATHACGLLAQEALPVIPDIVMEIDARQPDEGTAKTLNEELGKFYSIDYTKLIPHLISAIQEQQVTIAQLQADVAALKAAP